MASASRQDIEPFRGVMPPGQRDGEARDLGRGWRAMKPFRQAKLLAQHPDLVLEELASGSTSFMFIALGQAADIVVAGLDGDRRARRCTRRLR